MTELVRPPAISWTGDSRKLERVTLSHQVALHFLDLILKGELRPGMKLPAERELAAALGVGRPAVREGLSALHILGVVAIKGGDGVYVSGPDPRMLVRPLEIFAVLEGIDIRTLFEARQSLEVSIAGLAAEHMTDEEIAELQELVERLRQATEDSSLFLSLDEEMHGLITAGCRNALLSGVMVSIGALVHVYRRLISLFPTFNDQVVLDHENLVRAIVARDVEASRQAMRTHIQNVARITQQAEAGVDPTRSAPGAGSAELMRS